MRLMKRMGMLGMTLWIASSLYAQDEQTMEQNQAPMQQSSGDIILDYRGLMQKIDEMRTHEEEVLRKLEDLSKNYEDSLKRLEDTQKQMEDQIKDFKDWYAKAVKETNESNRSANEPTTIKGTIKNAPSDRYTSN